MTPNIPPPVKPSSGGHLIWLTLAVWTMDVVFNVLPSLIAGRQTLAVLVTSTAMASIGLGLSPWLYRGCAALGQRPAVLRYAGLAGMSFAFAGGVVLADLTLGSYLRAWVGQTSSAPSAKLFVAHIAGNVLGFAWMFGLLGAFYMMLLANRAVLERERQLADARTAAARAEGQATAARLAALRYQLNPHFLFNTLNAVSSAVITRRNEAAELMLEKLAEFLRVTLAADPAGSITIEDELATLQAYLEIESVRFRDRLDLDFSCPDDLRGASVPAFVLQPLIENAIKHGVSRSTTVVTIRLDVARDGDDLVVVVEDDAEPRGAAAKGAGLGLDNIRQRLEVLYGVRGQLRTTARDRGFIAELRLPFVLAPSERKARAA